MLPKFYRFRLKNETGVNIGVNEIKLVITRKKRGPSDNALAYEASPVPLQNALAIANNFVGTLGAEQDNSTPLWEEGEGTFEATISAATPSGDIILFFQVSGDGIVWPDDDRASNIVSIMNITTTTAERTDFEF